MRISDWSSDVCSSDLIIDAVVAASRTVSAGEPLVLAPVLTLIAIEAGLVMALAGAQRGISLGESLLRAQLGQRVNAMILEKAQTLQLEHLEDSEVEDKHTGDRREASSSQLAQVNGKFGHGKKEIERGSYGGGRGEVATEEGRGGGRGRGG